MFWVFSNHNPSCVYKVGCICDLKVQRYSVRNKVRPESCSKVDLFTFWLKDQYLASFSHLSFENEVRSLNIAKISRYCIGKNAPFLVKVTFTFKKLTRFCMEVFILWQCTNTNMLYKQTDWITEQLDHVLEKESAYRWQIARVQRRGKNGNDVSLTWRRLKNDESNTSAIWNKDNYWRNFFHRIF